MLVVNDYVLKDTCESRQDVLPHFVRVRCTYIAGILRTMMMVNVHLKKCNRIVKLFWLKQNVRGSFTGVIVNPTLFARADEIKSGVLRTMSAVNDYGE